MRRTKIVCTLGPATDQDGVLREMIKNGMDVARMNFSHGSHADHQRRINEVRKLREQMDCPVAIMQDTRGPEIRIGTFKNGKIFLRPGQRFTLYCKEIEGDEYSVSVNFEELCKCVKKGDRLLFADGIIETVVEEVAELAVTVIVKNGGYLSDRKSINLPDSDINLPYINETDEADIRFGVENKVEYIAASFVRSKDDVFKLRKYIKSIDPESKTRIISKIESADGVKNISEIIDASDGVMIARGDMGVEIEFEKLPEIQKDIIRKCLGKGKISITATQMLESMINNPRPTRAEVTDIANAIYDGTSAIMLSGETAAGKYPAKSVETMAKIALTTENSIDYKSRFLASSFEKDSVTAAVSHATLTTAKDLDAAAIVPVTRSGNTAYAVSGYRPYCPIIAATNDDTVYNQLALSWGVTPFKSDLKSSFAGVVESAGEKGYVHHGDIVVATGNSSPETIGTTNVLGVHRV